MQLPQRLLPVVLPLLAATSTVGCFVGPRAFQASHAAHNEALRTRIDEELLLNLVRLRYRDSPLFLQVGSVVTQFQLRGALGASGSLPTAGASVLDVDVGVNWSEQPTYTFQPLVDDDFVRRLLTPIDLELVVLLQRSGWSIERVLRLTVQSLGGLLNAPTASGPTPTGAPTFERFLRAVRNLRELQRAGRMQFVYESVSASPSIAIDEGSVAAADLVAAAGQGLRFEVAGERGTEAVLVGDRRHPVLLVAPPTADDDPAAELAHLFGRPVDATRYDLLEAPWTPGPIAPDGELPIVTRSLLGVFFYLSHGIDVPAEHVERGLVTVTRDAAGAVFDWRELTAEVLRVHVSASAPSGAAIAVPYRGHWFYIDDADLESKTTFALLIKLFNMSAGTSFGSGPTLTLPIGG